MRINFEEVKIGESANWIIFKAFIAQMDINKLFVFDFCGTELNTNASLASEYLELIRKLLCDRFGYAPYDIKKVEKNFNGHMCLDIQDKKWID